jgi:biopolymer transport protein TolR
MAMGPILGSNRRARRAPMAEINVTPFVDVMLVLLIIFMVAAPLLVAGVPIELPESKAKALDQETKPVQVSIEGGGAVFIDEVPVPADELGARLRQIASTSPQEGGPQLFLRADRGLPYGRVMEVMGEINAAGLRKVAMVSVQPGEGG